MLKYASGREQICLPNITTQNSTVSSAPGTYYIWVQARNDIGYNLPIGPATVVLGANQGISVSWSSVCFKLGEAWRRFALTVSTTNDASTAEVFCEVDCSQSNVSLASTVIEPYFLANPSALSSELPDAYVDGGANNSYGKGVITRFTDGYYYRYNKASLVSLPNSLASTKGGRWEKIHLPSPSIYLTNTMDPARGCDVYIDDIPDSAMILPLYYYANRSEEHTSELQSQLRLR
jgi:hypothetical protein